MRNIDCPIDVDHAAIGQIAHTYISEWFKIRRKRIQMCFDLCLNRVHNDFIKMDIGMSQQIRGRNTSLLTPNKPVGNKSKRAYFISFVSALKAKHPIYLLTHIHLKFHYSTLISLNRMSNFKHMHMN
jgi:hypothetical protein